MQILPYGLGELFRNLVRLYPAKFLRQIDIFSTRIFSTAGALVEAARRRAQVAPSLFYAAR